MPSEPCAPRQPRLAGAVVAARRRLPTLGVPLIGVAIIVAIGLTSGGDHVSALGSLDRTLAWMTGATDGITVEHQRVSYEGEELPYSQAPNDERLGVTSNVARVGGGAGTVLLLPDDPAYRGDRGYRAEWQSSIKAEEGSEYSYSASYYLPDDWYQGDNPRTFDDRIIFQFAEGQGTSPTFSLHIGDEPRFYVRHRLDNGEFQYLWSTPLQTERWYDFAFRVRWSREHDGYFQVYFNGQLVEHFEGITLNDSNRVYTKWGIYGQPTRLVVDEVSIVEGADGLFEVMPDPVNTLMTPVPSSGVGLVRFSGGDSAGLVASSGCPNSATFWFTYGGELVWYNPNAPSFVNARWNEIFGDGIPRNTLLIATCSGSG